MITVEKKSPILLNAYSSNADPNNVIDGVGVTFVGTGTVGAFSPGNAFYMPNQKELQLLLEWGNKSGVPVWLYFKIQHSPDGVNWYEIQKSHGGTAVLTANSVFEVFYDGTGRIDLRGLASGKKSVGLEDWFKGCGKLYLVRILLAIDAPAADTVDLKAQVMV